jgi:hypothetical protein
MRFEFLIVYFQSDGVDINALLNDKLAEVLADNLNEFDEAQVGQFMIPHLTRPCESQTDANGISSTRTILGFYFDLPDETANADAVISDFCSILSDTPPIVHLVKFEDPLLLQKNQTYAVELFHLEMKLRRVLSIVYLNSYDVEYYELLRDEITQPLAKEYPTAEQMRKVSENEFFHLTFGQYVGLNNRALPSKVSEIVEYLRESPTFESFKTELERTPVSDEMDRDFLASLRDRLDPVEKLRNCIAHNRAVPPRIAQDYATAKPGLEAELNGFLQRFGIANNNAGGETQVGNPEQQ